MKRTDDGVSPVVGVMLMLAITVMIAAIVSAAAGGLSETKKKAPSAVLDVTIYAEKQYNDCTIPSLVIKHVSGNVLQTKDLQLVLYYRTPSDIFIRGNLSGQHSVKGDDAWAGSGFTSGRYTGVLLIRDEGRFDSDPLQDSPGGNEHWFGNSSATFQPGDLLVTPAQYCTGSTSEHNPGMEYLFPGVDFTKDFRAGSVVTVKVIHIPSGQLIYDREVIIS